MDGPGRPVREVTPGDRDGLAAALELVGQRWALLIVRSLLGGAKRYGDLQRELGAPTNILATRLRELHAADILYRVPLAHNVLAYALTERGAALRESIDALTRWGEGEQR
nr:helix-turn-helix domain-containing protein [Planomonospora venezuelensis]